MECIRKESEQQQRQALDQTTRNEIVRDLVTQMFSYNSELSKDFCTKAAKLLVKKYPFMHDTGHKVSGYGSWEKKIIERVHNVRSRKRSRGENDFSPPALKRGRPRQQSTTLTRYPPLKDTGDDSITTSRNLEALHKEIKKDNPSREKVLSLCHQTFSKRREDILDDCGGNSATDLIVKYNELHRSYVVRRLALIFFCVTIS